VDNFTEIFNILGRSVLTTVTNGFQVKFIFFGYIQKYKSL